MSYYNEHDRFAAAWMRGLIGEGLIPPGDVDERDIQLVQPGELGPVCHFFAGIGGWAYALALAGWPADRPVWTGSCPCQPFSSAGKGEGFNDSRHLWPTWFRLIRECRPPIVFGEQVASPDGLAWFDHVSTDLESEGYAVGAADLAAGSVGAPHIRQRLFFVAYRAEPGRSAQPERATGENGRPAAEPRRLRDALGLADAAAARPARGPDSGAARGAAGSDARAGRDSGRVEPARESADAGSLGDATRQLAGDATAPDAQGQGGRRPAESGVDGCMGDTAGDGRALGRLAEHGDERGSSGLLADGPGARGPWDGAQPILCGDGKWRLVPAQPGLFPLASGVPNRVGTLRGSGNSIVPQVAAEFVRAFLEAEAEMSA